MVPIRIPIVIAHRGASGITPENTILSVNTAIVSQADIVEVDVQLTKDDEVVLFHDRDLSRILGMTSSIGDHTLSELKKYNYGKWFGSKFSEEIPTLEEILELRSEQSFIVEIKTISTVNRKLETLVLEILDDSSNDLGTGYISVRDLETYQWFRDHSARYRLGLMQKQRSCQVLFDLIEENSIEIVQIRSKSFEDNDYTLLSDYPVEAYVYWADTPSDWDYISSKGVDGILTNFPSIMRAHFIGKNR